MSLNWIDLHYDGVIYSKKNSKQIIQVHGKPILISNKNAKKNEQEMSTEFALQVMKAKWKPHGRYSVSMYFTRKDNVRRDLDNMATSVLDALVLGQHYRTMTLTTLRNCTSTTWGLIRKR